MSLEDERFPVGLRVLVVDDDITCLALMENLLQRCHYHVTTTNQAKEALRMLKENKNKFDIVITDVEMPDMDGIKLLQLVGLEMNLPVIMLSAYSDTKRVMQGIRNGACDYLVKPVRIQELQNIWQHVVRRNKSVPLQRTADQAGGSSTPDSTGNTAQDNSGDDNDDDDELEEGGRDNEDSATQKKPRLFWSVELHQKFVDAVNQLGLDKAFPKKILDLMDVEGLTREKVASHLQKYRLYLRKVNSGSSLQPGNRLGVFGGEDAHIGSLGGGYGIYRSLAGPGRFPGITSLPDQSGGMLGRLNTAAGLSIRGLSSSPMLQTPPQLPNSSNSFNTLGKFDPSSFSATTQNANLFQNIPTTMQISKSPLLSPPTNSMMLNGNPSLNSRDFSDQPSFFSPSSNYRALGTGGTANLLDPNSRPNWGTPIPPAVQSLPFSQDALPANVSSDGIAPVHAQIQNDPLDIFCGISSLDDLKGSLQSQDCISGPSNNFNNLGHPQIWQDQRPDYLLNSCNIPHTSSSLITAVAPTAGENERQSNNNMMSASPFSQLEGVSSQILQQNEVQKSIDDSNLKFDENFLLSDPKLLSASSQSTNSEYLEDIVGRFLKQGNGETATGREDFGLDPFLM
ncbi:two-component response regulator ARR10 [Beta vulgaris subsp. vulgaris]|uniref:two-component response regulator ARR10 n=1 Tax=Beta vulgaris subsp. vulgaris TaxID=3555 RepID=UPI002549BC38|nr:two-component response regulator ARR10 [Beta vulgaris subsp. vulgaris]